MGPQDSHGHDASFRRMVVGAIGVVFGDIGTSPLYTMKLAFGSTYGLRPVEAEVLGILSLVFWSLVLVVTVKYVAVIMRADNRGEGGIMALMALAQRSLPLASEKAYLVGILGIFGAALFFGDAVITPAMSVLSAVEGIGIAAPALGHWVVPITIGILVGLFVFQRRGTAAVGAVFGPVCVAWFAAIGALGLAHLAANPSVLAAVNPAYMVAFFASHGAVAFLVLGAVVLAVTGGEALYADMGHFGRRPIQFAWLWLVLPCLLLNYFGQGALILSDPAAAANPFYRMVPGGLLPPMIVLATAATVIASQAVISGAFSLARQAMLLGYVPRMKVLHTSADSAGQVYLPWVNRALLYLVVGLVLTFQTSDDLAAAYGISVTGTMIITTVLMLVVCERRWHLPRPMLWAMGLLFLGIDGAFLAACLFKVAEGGWFPLALAACLFTVMRTWRRGRELIRDAVRRDKVSLAHFIRGLDAQAPIRVPGTAVFLTASNDSVPDALLLNLRHNRILHQRIVLLTVEALNSPRSEPDERVAITDLGGGFHRVTLRFGFLEDPNVPRALPECERFGLALEPREVIYFASRETVVSAARRGMPGWRDRIFAFMLRNTVPATAFFRIPGDQLVELGAQVEI